MENVFLTSLTTPEVRQLFRQELENFFSNHPLFCKNPIQQEESAERFTISELAKYLNCTKGTIHNYKNRGILPYYQTGRKVFFKKSDVETAMAITFKNRQ